MRAVDPGSDLSDLAQLLGADALAGFIAGKPSSEGPRLKPLSRRLTARALLEFVAGRRGSRRAYLSQLLRRYLNSHGRNKEILALLAGGGTAGLAADQRLLPGIGHYGLFHAEIGIGQGARRLATAMRMAEIPLSVHDVFLPQFESKVDFEATDVLNSPHDTILFQFNADTFLELFDRFPLSTMLRRRRIGHWVWELPVLPPKWVPAFDKLHEVWVPTKFVAEAVANATEKPVRIVPYPVPLDDFPQFEARKRLDLPQDSFIFLMIFDLNSFPSRKNPLGTIRAFIEAFPDHGASSPILVIKCHGQANRGDELKRVKEFCSANNRLILIDRVFSEHEMTMMQSACDCLISLHRAEGFGLNIAECMAKGKIVVATDFSGSRDFARPENSLLVPYKMAEVGKTGYVHGAGQWWAEPDHGAAVEMLRRAAANSSDIQRLATRARADIARDYSYETIGRIARAAWLQELEPFRP